ncbi:MAG: hypothetical protein U0401_01370 [Anaerolineae bacterium]
MLRQKEPIQLYCTERVAAKAAETACAAGMNKPAACLCLAIRKTNPAQEHPSAEWLRVRGKRLRVFN